MSWLPDGVVHLWWALHRRADVSWLSELDPGEQDRYHAYRQPDDRARFLTGATLVRRVFATDLSVPPAIVRVERSCPDCSRPHGRVRLAAGQAPPEREIQVSVSHSGRWVVVAACRSHRLGVDVERVDRTMDHAGVGRIALTDSELVDLLGLPEADRARGFIRYWVRKEAVVKALGEGLRISPAEVELSAASEAPRVISAPGRPHLPGQLQLYDLDSDADHLAALAVLDARPVSISRRDAAELLDPPA